MSVLLSVSPVGLYPLKIHKKPADLDLHFFQKEDTEF